MPPGRPDTVVAVRTVDRCHREFGVPGPFSAPRAIFPRVFGIPAPLCIPRGIWHPHAIVDSYSCHRYTAASQESLVLLLYYQYYRQTVIDSVLLEGSLFKPVSALNPK